jgi:hypothetical protein
MSTFALFSGVLSTSITLVLSTSITFPGVTITPFSRTKGRLNLVSARRSFLVPAAACGWLRHGLIEYWGRRVCGLLTNGNDLNEAAHNRLKFGFYSD